MFSPRLSIAHSKSYQLHATHNLVNYSLKRGINMSEEERINKQIEDNIKGHEIPAPENNFTEVSEENKEAMLNAETPAR